MWWNSFHWWWKNIKNVYSALKRNYTIFFWIVETMTNNLFINVIRVLQVTTEKTVYNKLWINDDQTIINHVFCLYKRWRSVSFLNFITKDNVCVCINGWVNHLSNRYLCNREHFFSFFCVEASLRGSIVDCSRYQRLCLCNPTQPSTTSAYHCSCLTCLSHDRNAPEKDLERSKKNLPSPSTRKTADSKKHLERCVAATMHFRP